MKKILITSLLSTLILGNLIFSNKVYQESYKNNIEGKINETSKILYNYKLVKQNLQKDKLKFVWICEKLGFNVDNGTPDAVKIWEKIEEMASDDTLLNEFLILYEYDTEVINSLTGEQKRAELINCINNSLESIAELERINNLVDEQGVEVFGSSKWDTSVTIDEKLEAIIEQLESNESDARTLLEQSNTKIEEANQEIQRLDGIISTYEEDMDYLERQLEYVIAGHRDILPKEE